MSDVSFRDVDSAASRFAALRGTASQEDLDLALETARRTAAVDTNAIEGVFTTDRGFTRIVATKASGWKQLMSSKGDHALPSFEDTLAGIELVLDHTTAQRPVTETVVRKLHETMLRSHETHTVYVSVNGELVPQTQKLPKGEYKHHANNPTRTDGSVHAYAPAEDTAFEMSRFIDELRSAEFEAAHPISQTAYAHYAFVCIHPFADGNGRVARALASIYLYCSPGVPLVIFHDQRAKYIDALEAADRGQFHSLMRFIADEVTDTVNLINDELSGPVSGSSAGELAALLSEDGFPSTALDAAGRMQEILREELHARLEKKADDLVLSFMVHGAVIGEAPSAPKGYLPINKEMAVTAFVNARSGVTRKSWTVN